jgi:hypothetical protein
VPDYATLPKCGGFRLAVAVHGCGCRVESENRQRRGVPAIADCIALASPPRRNPRD